MENFNLEIKKDTVLNELLYLVQYGYEELNLPSYLCVAMEDMEDYICDLKDILIKYYLSDYFEDAINKYLDKIIEGNENEK